MKSRFFAQFLNPVLLLVAAVAAAPSARATDVSGTISTSTTWTLAGSPYNVTGNVLVAGGVTLAIEAGVQVRFWQYKELAVDGTLNATGTAVAPVVFAGTSATPGWWSAIVVRNNGSGSFDYCEVRNAGYYYSCGIYKSGGGSLSLRHSLVTGTSGAGLCLFSGASSIVSQNNRYENNTHGVRLGLNTSFTDTTSTFTGNSASQVVADGGTHTMDVAWELSPEYAIFLPDNQAVAAGATLTLKPGLVLKMAQFRTVYIDGHLTAHGSAGSRIHITDYRDDSVGGDTNNDGAASAPGAGWWGCIQVRNNGSATMEYCTVAYGGYYDFAGVCKFGSGALRLSHCTLRKTAGAGLRLTSGSSDFTSENNTYADNTHGVRLGVNTSFTDTTSTFSGNSASQVVADGGTHTTDVAWELSPAYAVFLPESQSVATGATLTFKPGLVVKMAQFRTVYIDGQLDAQGSAISPIHITDYRDDSVGGDTNSDGAASAPGAGWWGCIQVRNNGSAVMEYCNVSYGGYYDWAGVFKHGTGALSLRHCTLRKTAGAGLRVNADYSSFATEYNTFADNTHGVRLGLNTSFSDTTSEFTGNSASQVVADTGNLSTNVMWELSPVYSVWLPETLTVVEGASLTLKPGITLKFAQYKGLVIYGQLNAAGTEAAPIHFTDYRDDTVGGDTNANSGADAPSPGWWASIQTRINGSATLEHCTVSYGGYYDLCDVYKTGNGSMSLRHCVISHTAGAGLRMLEGTGAFTTEYNQFIANSAGVRLGVNTSFVDHTSVFSNNAEAPVTADGGTHTKAVRLGLSSQYAILVTGSQTVSPTGSLTILPGTVLKFARYTALYVEGALTATGTQGSPIHFTDQRDDSVGGDTNADGELSAPSADWWIGLQVRKPATAVLHNVHLRYAGYYDRSGIRKYDDCSLSMVDCEVSRVLGSALLLYATTATGDILRCRFTDSTAGAYVHNTAAGIAFHGCQFVSNSEFGVRAQGSATVDARGAWWGEATGPYHPTLNPDGKGDRVSDGVLFDPWRGSAGSVRILSPLRSGTIVAGDTLRLLGSASDDPSHGYLWNFGDGRTSTVRNPGLAAFSQAGQQTLSYAVVIGGEPDPFPETRDYSVVTDTGSHPDLRLDVLEVPASIGIGQPSTLSYTVTNAGPGPVVAAAWTDRAYLSDDSVLDAGDAQLAAVTETRSLAPGASYEGSLPLTLPPVSEGAHYIILSANDEWSVVELHRLNNEKPASVSVLVQQLQQGVQYAGNHPAGAAAQYLRIDVPASGNLVLSFTHSNPALGAAVRFGALPTPSAYDYSFSGQTLVIPSAPAGTWYVLVHGEGLSAAGSFTLSYSIGDLTLTACSPASHDAASALQLLVDGAGFAAPVGVQLVAANGTPYAAGSVAIDSFTALTASFAAGQLPPGAYTLRVNRGAATATLPSALQVVSGGKPEFHVDIVSPDRMGYHQLATLFVEYGNRGNAPMPAPLLLVTALQNGKTGALFTFDSSRLSEGFWTSAIPKGFSTSVRLMAGGAQPGILQPGERMRVPVYYAGWLKPWDFAYPPFEFKVVALTDEDTQPLDWPVLSAALKPDYADADAWSAISQNFIAGVGNTVGDFVRMLSANATYLARLGEDVRDVNTLVTFELLKAGGVLNPYSELVGNVDLFPSPGLVNLWFTRSFPRGLANRFRLGPMGYGWSHGYEASLAREADGTVVISYGNGAKRVYQPDSRSGGYFAGAGDNARLAAAGGGAFTLTEIDGTRYTFNSTGALDRVEDRNGNTLQLQYTAGKLTRVTHNNGLYLTLSYNAAGLLSQVSDSLGNRCLYGYDANKHLVSFTDAHDRVTQYAYAPSTPLQARHALAGITYPYGAPQVFTYDGNGRLAAFTDGINPLTYAYNQGDIAATDGAGHTSVLSFNHKGILCRVLDPDGGVTSLSHDAALHNTSIRAPDGSLVRFSYNRDGAVTRIVDQFGNAWTYEPGAFGQVGKVTTPAGRVSSLNYDGEGNLTRITYPDGAYEAFEHDPAGRILKHTDARGMVETTTLNSAGLAISKSYSDGTSRQFTYDAKSRMTSATNAAGATNYEYDGSGNLTRISYPNGLHITYAYDAAGRLTSTTDDKGQVNRYVYNTSGLLERVLDAASADVVRYTYDAAGRLSEKRFASGARTVYSRNAAAQITHQTTYSAGGGVLAEFTVTYDSMGRPAAYQTPQGAYTYAYDASGHLLQQVFTPTSGPAATTRYQRDRDGLLAAITADGVTTALTLDASGRPVSFGAVTLGRDASGRLTSRTGSGDPVTYSYAATGQLAAMQTGGATYRMTYDATGIPLALDGPATHVKYLYDQQGAVHVFGEYTPAGAALRGYQYGIGLAKVAYQGSSYFPEFDPLRGETVLALGAGGGGAAAMAAPVDYFPFSPPYAYGDPFMPLPDYHGYVMDGYMSMASDAFNAGSEAYAWAVDRSGMDQTVGDLCRNWYFSTGVNVAGLFGAFNDINDGAGKLLGVVVKVTDAPSCVESAFGFLTHNNTGKALGAIGIVTGGIEAIDGISETWSEGRSVDVVDVLTPFGSIDSGTFKTRHGIAGAIGAALGIAAIGTAAAPVAGVAAVAAFISDNTMGLQESFWIWWDGLDVTGETLRGSAFSGSQDPNQKLGVNGYGTANYVAGGTRLTYRIDFENHPGATAPAQVVTIRDRLPPETDPDSFEMLEFGFGDVSVTAEPGTRTVGTVVPYVYQDGEYAFAVDVHVEARIENGELFAIFYTIDPATGLPPPVQTGFLPPEPEPVPGTVQPGEGRGRGHLTYVVRPRASIPSGTAIRNVATIQFDFSLEIDTNQVDPLDPAKGTDPAKEALVTIDSDTPQAAVEALPELCPAQFLVKWGGSSASGLRSYDVYYRAGAGAWQAWLRGTSATSAVFSGTPYTVYDFYAVGTNNVGVRAPYSPAIQAYTTAGAGEVDLVIGRTADRRVRLSWTAIYGFQYQLQSSADNATWTPVGPPRSTNQASEVLAYTDTAYDFARNRFYRVVVSVP